MSDAERKAGKMTIRESGPPPDKAGLRRWMRGRLETADKAALKQADEQICRRLRQLPEFTRAHTVLAFAPLPGEIDIWPLLAELAAGAKRLCLPLLSGPGLMEAREAGDLTRLKPNRYGIAEPPPGAPLVAPGDIGLVLVPGLAFDKGLWRLGRGGGYYDRFLPACGAFRLGLARELQIVEQLPRETHDLRMQALLSELAYTYGQGFSY
jgi:5-formyltetrahydrofolate cyclo-ligase